MRKLGDYTLTRRLGAGGMGEVWMGRRETLGAARDVAIKLLSPDRATDAEARKMFLDEARLSMLLRNSNIVQVHDVAEAGDKTCYMVMEYVEGLNLSELDEKMRRAGESIPDSITAFIIGEVLKGLAHAHELRDGGQRKTVVHRDVSPHNVMLSIFGEVKIMDFGIARVASEDTSGVHVKGKLRYMPPEQLRGETREPTLDLFAVGAMLHELLDGVKFRSKVRDEGRLYGMILDGEVPAMLRAPETIPHELDELRRMLLAAKPSERIQSAREAFRRLTAWSGYRDTRFELDELVRRYVGNGEPQPGMVPTNMLEAPIEEPTAVEAPPEEPPLKAAGSFTGADIRASDSAAAATEGTATVVLPADGSDTDIARRGGSDTDTAVSTRASRDARTPNRSLRIAALAIMGLACGGFGVSAMLGLWNDEPARVEPKHERVAVVDEPVQPIADDPAPPQPSLEQPRPPTVIETPSNPATDEAPAAGSEDESDSETPPDLPTPKAKAEPPRPETSPEPAIAKTKVTLTLGSGVGWAEIKLGGRTYELDPFSNKSISTRLRPGSHTVSCRTKDGDPFKSAGRIEIPDHEVAVQIQKNGTVTVE